jgi:hypothetical protein
MKNIGFRIFLFLTIGFSFLLIIYLIRGYNSVKNYIINEMAKKGYIKNFKIIKKRIKNQLKRRSKMIQILL